MQIPFTKMHGLGNNYVYIDLFNYEIDEKLYSDLAIHMSDIYTGIGSDGMILIHPTTAADVGMRIFNKDGSEGKSCGNGLRCTAKYAYENGIVQNRKFHIQTKANIVEAEVSVDNNKVDQVTIDMGEPILARNEIPMMGNNDSKVVNEPFVVAGETQYVTAVSMGNPHAVFFVNDIAEAPLETLGPTIEKDMRFPESINVEFIEVVSSTEINFRVWERGSGITQACGTGACAAVVAATLNEKVTKSHPIVVHLAGGDLNIEWKEDNHVWMTGPAEVIASGLFYYKGK
ncbi:diaminopimelate epimerase [Oceanobacillus kimchii]|uniref:Diaminopimelate epimerase n=1 Tax=Oceanobacillus kimchii TaxID=746691 RepID=A0ABQ5TMN7_9BACI|nr:MULTISPECIES: diaminopimelate epimerase [Oceanobacillus]MCT1579088.1 diaminopimelate epimerase [Oceanobacillus kimchii]MCT2137384.1 diaminopimelate epimerase [Oceanobacillus kimchii]OEH54028.1 diaminopimelate epimerase [Oceanobacillus sp. E9]GLO67019.1 diaminopimelate epimerase [Oceanobacillus kimchii]